MISELPDIALDIIWNELEDEDRHKLRLVSKSWNSIVNPRIFKSFNITDYNNLKLKLIPKYGPLVVRARISEVEFKINDFFERCPNVHSLTLKRVELIHQEAEENPKLKNLSIALDGRNVSEKDIFEWKPMIENFINLTTLVLLDFDPITAQNLFYSLPKLIKFKYLSNGTIIPKAWKGNYLSKLNTYFDSDFKNSYVNTNLRELYVKSYHKFSIDKDLFTINSTCFPNLNKLTLILWDGYLLNTEGYDFKHLKSLHINYKEFTAQMLDKLIENNNRIYHLHVHKLTNNIQIPLNDYTDRLKSLSHLHIDLSNSELDTIILEELPTLQHITHLGIHFSHLTKSKLYLLSSKFPKVQVFEFIGAVINDKQLSFELAEMFSSSMTHGLSFNWNTLIVPDFNHLIINVIKFCLKLKKLYHRFKISDISPDEASNLLKYTHKDLSIAYWVPKEDF
ncbi:hypothetical protein K502DRAFT_323103 [Neoconidiobolus thromboides FSU 785]|nr:hypothetical protein K502DRAFT_323103 [Neoconidiobolus thromboides FSU 785]